MRRGYGYGKLRTLLGALYLGTNLETKVVKVWGHQLQVFLVPEPRQESCQNRNPGPLLPRRVDSVPYRPQFYPIRHRFPGAALFQRFSSISKLECLVLETCLP